MLRRNCKIFDGALVKWQKDNAFRLGAALSYYTVFSLSPLLILVLGIVGLVFGAEAARGELSRQIEGLVGTAGANAIQSFIADTHHDSTGLIASIVGVLAVVLGATGVFVELKSALNKIWEVTPATASGVWIFFKDRLLSFAMVLAIGFLLLVSLVLNAALAAASKYMAEILPASPIILETATFVGSFGSITLLFALLFKFLPDRRVEWRDVWVGAVLTSAFFTIGKLLIGLYLGKSSVASSFGASASVIIIMIWTYYSSLIFFFGAEFTRVSADLGKSEGELKPQTNCGKLQQSPGTLSQESIAPFEVLP